ncbi:MBOA7 acyltransferase, partial [Amia calva]|nr:MBOA7 acyltransferase [Amia calva]
MSPDELVYVGVLLTSIPIGFLFRHLSPPVKQGAALLLGLCVTLGTCGFHSIHSAVTVLGTWAIITAHWRRAPSLCLGWTFLYLLFFRLAHLAGLPMISLAHDVRDFHLAKKGEMTSLSKSPVIGGLTREPSLYDIISYSYCYIGIMTGPFFRFQTYQDWVCQREPWTGWLPGATALASRLRLVPVFGALFLGADALFPLAFVRSPAFPDSHFLFRLFYMSAVFFVFRMRFFAAWQLAEGSCVSAGLGGYPRGTKAKPGGGPTVQYSAVQGDPDSQCDFETVRNIDWYNTEFCTRVRHGMRYWNMSVQWWLHSYIYNSAPFRSYVLRAGWTMLVSAFWHGIHAGYYLSFLTVPLCLWAESSVERGVRARLGPGGQGLFDWVHWFLKMRCYDYMCMGFVLLRWRDTLHYWGSVGYCVHLLAVCAVALGVALGPVGERQGRAGGREREGGKREKKEGKAE